MKVIRKKTDKRLVAVFDEVENAEDGGSEGGTFKAQPTPQADDEVVDIPGVTMAEFEARLTMATGRMYLYDSPTEGGAADLEFGCGNKRVKCEKAKQPKSMPEAVDLLVKRGEMSESAPLTVKDLKHIAKAMRGL